MSREMPSLLTWKSANCPQYFAEGTQIGQLQEVLNECDSMLTNPEQLEQFEQAIARKKEAMDAAEVPYKLLKEYLSLDDKIKELEMQAKWSKLREKKRALDKKAAEVEAGMSNGAFKEAEIEEAEAKVKELEQQLHDLE
jgi:chromosome segregation ATPase